MKVSYENGDLRVPFFDALQELPPAQKLELVESMACDDDIIKFVVQQILDGWTENGNHAGKFASAIAQPAAGLDWACREVATRSGDVARQEIERLQNALAGAEKRYQELCWEREEERRGRFA